MKKAKFDVIENDEDINIHRDNLKKDIENDAVFMNYLRSCDIRIEDFAGFLNVIHDCFVSQKNCRNCKGLEHCKNEEEGYTAFLDNDGDYLQKEFRKCPYKVESDDYYNAFVIRDFEDKDVTLSLDYLDSLLKGNALREKVSSAFKSRINGSNKWMYISGVMNSDKSRFAIAFCNDYLKKYSNTKICFAKYSTLLSDCSAVVFSNKEEFKRKYNELLECDILVLDDFANGYINSVTRDSLVLPLINDRAKKDKLTIFTSRYGIRDAARLISIKDHIIEEQILGMLASTCDNFKLNKEIL